MADPFEPISGEPVSIVIGHFVAWTIADEYDADLFALKYVFASGSTIKEIAGASVDGVWTFTASGTVTRDMRHGRNTVDLVVTRLADDESRVLRTMSVQCFSNDADRRSHAQLMVDKIESILAGRADQDVESYTIKSRSITKMSIKELTDWREYYLAELGRQADPITGRRKNNNTLMIGFK
jgi:hypothetical protein